MNRPRTVISYCAALSSCERLGAWRQAFEVLTAMEGAKLRSDVTWMPRENHGKIVI
jgi:hypothetical protein